MKKAGALANALRSNGGNVAAPAPSPSSVVPEATPPGMEKAQPSRRETKPITVHFPEQVRRQLKALAAEEGRHVEDMVAEGLNLLFARYRRPEIAPRKV
jgi:Antitoxin-like ribbon-helix-helix